MGHGHGVVVLVVRVVKRPFRLPCRSVALHRAQVVIRRYLLFLSLDHTLIEQPLTSPRWKPSRPPTPPVPHHESLSRSAPTPAAYGSNDRTGILPSDSDHAFFSLYGHNVEWNRRAVQAEELSQRGREVLF